MHKNKRERELKGIPRKQANEKRQKISHKKAQPTQKSILHLHMHEISSLWLQMGSDVGSSLGQVSWAEWSARPPYLFVCLPLERSFNHSGIHSVIQAYCKQLPLTATTTTTFCSFSRFSLCLPHFKLLGPWPTGCPILCKLNKRQVKIIERCKLIRQLFGQLAQ